MMAEEPFGPIKAGQPELKSIEQTERPVAKFDKNFMQAASAGTPAPA
jgi:hypothetical protein